MDTDFPDFFDNYGGAYGVNIKDRLAEIDSNSAKPWVDFLNYSGGPDSPYYRYLFHQEAIVDPVRERIYLIGGQGVGFEYTFERYYHEVREVLTDARAYQFFQMYDRFGPGFASLAGWAKNKLSASIREIYLIDDTSKWVTKPGIAKEVKYNPNLPLPEISRDAPDHELMTAGQDIYKKQCTPCHGILGDGKDSLPKDSQLSQEIFVRESTNSAQPKLANSPQLRISKIPFASASPTPRCLRGVNFSHRSKSKMLPAT